MTELPLPYRVARTSADCLFSGINMALKGWLGRK